MSEAARLPMVTTAAPARALGWQVWTALGLVYVIWGSTYLAIRITVHTLPPLYAASARFLVAGLLLLGFTALRKEWHTVNWRGVGLAAVPGVLLMAGGNGAVSIAEQTLESSLAALIVASAALLMALITMVVDRRLVSLPVGAGLIVGFGGLVLLLHPSPGSHVPLAGGLVMIVSVVLWASGSVFAGRAGSNGMSGAATSGFQMLSGAVGLAVGGLIFGEHLPTAITADMAPSLIALAYLIFIGALVGFTAYSWLLSHAPLSIVSTYAYVNPVVAIGLGVLLLHEQLGWLELVAAAVILAGVALIVSAPKRTA